MPTGGPCTLLELTELTCDSSSLCELLSAFTMESRNLSQKVLYSNCSSGQEKSKSAVSRPVMFLLKVRKAKMPVMQATTAIKPEHIGMTIKLTGVRLGTS